MSGASGRHAPEKTHYENATTTQSTQSHQNRNHISRSQLTPIDHCDAIEILSCARRRWAVEYLADQPTDTTVTISDLSEHVAAKENECTVLELGSKQRERVYVSLYQTHLITMQSIIEYDRDRGTITPTEALTGL